MRSLAEAYAPSAEDCQHKLEASIEDGVTLTGDRQLLAQMVSNLVENALAHTPAGSVVRLSLRKP
jgi:signal transduction histidine kinase